MFKKKHERDKNNLSVTSPMIINRQSQMTGDFMLSTDIKIDGRVQGNVETIKSVIIGESGSMKGTLKCQTLKLLGHFDGAAEVSGTAYLYSTAVYTGRLNAPCISVSPGCRIAADINLRDNEKISHPGVDLPGKVVPEQGPGPDNEKHREDSVKNAKDDARNSSTENRSFLLNNLSED